MNILNPRLFNPLHWHLMPLLQDPAIRYIYIEGGSSASKTAEVTNALLIDQLARNYSSIVFRRFHVNIRDSVYNSFKLADNRLGFNERRYYTFLQDWIKSNVNNAVVRFKGLDDEENIKGIEDYDIVFNNEWSQFTEEHWGQQRKRLRGRPNQKFICDWNPISAQIWFYANWLDLDTWIDLPLDMPDAPTAWTGLNPDYSFKRINAAGNSVWIKITYRDNFWITGHPTGQGGFIDEATLADFEWDRQFKPNLYRVYANGERGIMRTGGEFFKQFNELKHVRPVKMDPRFPLHISLDENVNPYVTCSCWQLIDKEIRQVDEVVARTPENNAPKAALKLISLLRASSFANMIYVYGDPTGSKRSTIDANSASFYEKYTEVLRAEGYRIANRVGRSAPEVALSAAFINEIYEIGVQGYSIVIGDRCKVSIEDYAMVKEDKDGTMVKVKVKEKITQVTYEPYGHFSDAKRYLIIELLRNEWEAWKKRKSNLALKAGYFR